VTQTDRQKRELVALRDEDVQARDGLNVVLTLDAAIQHIVETSLADALQKHTPSASPPLSCVRARARFWRW